MGIRTEGQQLSNARADDYGGSLDSRARFLLETLAAVRERVGEEFIVGREPMSLVPQQPGQGGIKAALASNLPKAHPFRIGSKDCQPCALE